MSERFSKNKQISNLTAAADLFHAFGRTKRKWKIKAAFRNFVIAPKIDKYKRE